eukprot:sb/3479388/
MTDTSHKPFMGPLQARTHLFLSAATALVGIVQLVVGCVYMEKMTMAVVNDEEWWGSGVYEHFTAEPVCTAFLAEWDFLIAERDLGRCVGYKVNWTRYKHILFQTIMFAVVTFMSAFLFIPIAIIFSFAFQATKFKLYICILYALEFVLYLSWGIYACCSPSPCIRTHQPIVVVTPSTVPVQVPVKKKAASLCSMHCVVGSGILRACCLGKAHGNRLGSGLHGEVNEGPAYVEDPYLLLKRQLQFK